MAAGFTPYIGTGPTDVCPTCDHTDCQANRELIATACRWCGEPLGEGVPFYFVPDSAGGQTVAHAACEEAHARV
jgi:hypothetical protein